MEFLLGTLLIRMIILQKKNSKNCNVAIAKVFKAHLLSFVFLFLFESIERYWIQSQLLLFVKYNYIITNYK